MSARKQQNNSASSQIDLGTNSQNVNNDYPQSGLSEKQCLNGNATTNACKLDNPNFGNNIKRRNKKNLIAILSYLVLLLLFSFAMYYTTSALYDSKTATGTIEFEFEESRPMVRFSSSQAFSLSTNNNAKNWDGTLSYSANRTAFTEWDGTTTLNAGKNGSKYYLYLAGENNTYLSGTSQGSTSNNCGWKLTGNANISCSGNIENLLDYPTVADGEHPMMAKFCYQYLFYNCSKLVSTPTLPATTLTGGCYFYMFYGCTSLKVINSEAKSGLNGYETEYLDMRKCTNVSGSCNNMFANTANASQSGFKATPESTTIYYIHSSNSIVPATSSS